MPCLNGGRETLRTDPRRTPPYATDVPSDLPRATSDGTSALLPVARKTGWPPYIPVAAGPA